VKSGGSSDTLRLFSVSRLCILLSFLFIFSFFSFGFSVLGDPFEDTQLSISPSTQTVDANDNFTIDVYCSPGQPIKAFELKISFDSSLVSADTVSEGDIFAGYSTFFNSGTIDNYAGRIVNVYGLIIGQGNVTGNGTLVSIEFTADEYSGTSDINFIDIGTWTTVVNETGYVPIDVANGSVEVVGGSDPPSPPPPPPGGGGFYFPPIPDENNPPETPLKPSGPSFVEMGVEYTYSSSTFDIDDDQVRLKFDWGDGNYSSWSDFVDSNTSVSMSHSWNNISTYAVRAIAQDSQGLNSSWSSPLNVSVSQGVMDFPPVLDINLSGNSSINGTIIFDASKSYDLGGYIVSYEWDFGDGTTGSGISTSHTYNKSGEYTIILTVTDDLGGVYSKSMTVKVGSEGQMNSDEKTAKLTFSVPMLLIGSSIALIVFVSIIFKDKITLRYLKIQKYILDSKRKRFLK
jgi:chitodextrinase